MTKTGTISIPGDHATDLRLFFSFLSDFFSLPSPATSDFLDFFFSFLSLGGAEAAAAEVVVVVGSSSTSIRSAFRFTWATLCSRCGSTRSTIALVVVSVAPKGRFRNFSFSSGWARFLAAVPSEFVAGRKDGNVGSLTSLADCTCGGKGARIRCFVIFLGAEYPNVSR